MLTNQSGHREFSSRTIKISKTHRNIASYHCASLYCLFFHNSPYLFKLKYLIQGAAIGYKNMSTNQMINKSEYTQCGI